MVVNSQDVPGLIIMLRAFLLRFYQFEGSMRKTSKTKIVSPNTSLLRTRYGSSEKTDRSSLEVHIWCTIYYRPLHPSGIAVISFLVHVYENIRNYLMISPQLTIFTSIKVHHTKNPEKKCKFW